MQEICLFLASEQKLFKSLNRDLVSKYFLVVFTLSFIRSFRAENDYLVYPIMLQ